MIDFYSTRDDVDPQTAACANLLLAVITQAIKDASAEMSKKEKQLQRNINSEARQALQFLFGRKSVFPLYAELIGTSAEAIRAALLDKPKALPPAKKPPYTEAERRIFHGRYRWAAGNFEYDEAANKEAA